MDRQQRKIFEKILSKNHLSNKAMLIQYRNLKEFRYFSIEKINPNHIIELYGKLKNSNPKKEVCLNVHVGRIIIPYISIVSFLNFVMPIQAINFILLLCCMLLISICIYHLFTSINVMRLLYDCFNRRYQWGGKLRFG